MSYIYNNESFCYIVTFKKVLYVFVVDLASIGSHSTINSKINVHYD